MRSLMATWDIRNEYHPDAKALLEKPDPVIIAVYHGRMGALLDLKRREKTSVLISNSRDGEMVAKALLGLKFKVSRGSPKHGALQAAKSMLAALHSGLDVVVTVDGPQGPAMEVKPAVIRLAQTSGTPIIPIVMDASFKLHMNSWDDFMYPSHFSRVYTIYGAPLMVQKGRSESLGEEYRLELQKRMDEIVQIAAAKIKQLS
ncbi:MAG TPA: lysophospholipid acyltransferase family protein [Oculatellaceae cyanobacterium]